MRMSAIEKDSHLLCPTHTGFFCTIDQRCDICTSWTDDQMKSYCALQAAKARKKAYRARKKDKDRSSNLSDSLEEGNVSDSVFISQGSSNSGLSQISPVKELGSVEIPVALSTECLSTDGRKLVSRAVAGERQGDAPPESSPVCHPQQESICQAVLGSPNKGLVTPSLPRPDFQPRSGFDTSMESALGRIAYQFRDLSPRSQVRKMRDFLNTTDPSLSSYSSRRSRSAHRSGASRSSALEDAYFKSSERTRRDSVESTGKLQEVVTVASVHREASKRESESVTPNPKRVLVSRDWARMIESGGAVWRSEAIGFWRDESGIEHDVVLPRDGPGEGSTVGHGLGVAPFPVETQLPPYRASSSQVDVRQSEESRGSKDSVVPLIPVETGLAPSSASQKTLVTAKSGWAPSLADVEAVESPGGSEALVVPGVLPLDSGSPGFRPIKEGTDSRPLGSCSPLQETRPLLGEVRPLSLRGRVL